MANPVAAPGTVVPSGSLLTPTGPSGYLGPRGLIGAPLISGAAWASSTSTWNDAAAKWDDGGGNIARLGSDSQLYVPLGPASASTSGLVNRLSGSTRDLIDGSNNTAEIEVRASWKKRYYYAWHCDHPSGGNIVVAASGTGATAAPTTSEINHPGVYSLSNGTVASSYGYYASSSVADIQLGLFTKFAFRVVMKVNTVPPAMAYPPPYYYYAFGLSSNSPATVPDTTTSTATPLSDGIFIIFNNSFNPYNHWYINCKNSASYLTTSNIDTGVTVTPGWWDLSFYWDPTGSGAFGNVKARVGPWNGTTPPTLFGPYVNNVPFPTTNLYWMVGSWTSAASSGWTAYPIGIDLVEVAGEYATPGGFRGEELVTTF